MQYSKGNNGYKELAVAIHNGKSSRAALKWTLEQLHTKEQIVTLIHVRINAGSHFNGDGRIKDHIAKEYKKQLEDETEELIQPFRCYCKRKNVQCKMVILDEMSETNISKAIANYLSNSVVDTLVIGSASKTSIVKQFKSQDIADTLAKDAPKFCNVYIICKGKISHVQSASSPAPSISPINYSRAVDKTSFKPRKLMDSTVCSSPLPIDNGTLVLRSCTEDNNCSSVWESNISCSSDTRSSSNLDHGYSPTSVYRSTDLISSWDCSSSSSVSSSHSSSELEAELRRLKLELKQSIIKYSVASKEANSATHKTTEVGDGQIKEISIVERFRQPLEVATLLLPTERKETNYESIVNTPHQWMSKKEGEADDEKSIWSKIDYEEQIGLGVRYRKYTIQEMEEATDFFAMSNKIGEGGYGPVYKGTLDHTPVAIKILRPDASEGRSQFNKEVEVLSCIRHPHMVLLLGACPENGSLVYEFMSNGSLEDRLFCKGNTPPLPLYLRFRIAAEIATGLLFLHQTKPEPLVHRDLKPANVLLDHNYVSKISDVGLARLVPPSVADELTQYHMTSAAGTFCYIDPEYQQTCMLGTKSDVYSLGIMLLQIITAKPPMGLAHKVEVAIENGSFAKILDPNIPDWPIEQALSFATLALKCAELRKRERPDLRQIVPELNRLRSLVEENFYFTVFPNDKCVHLSASQYLHK